MFESNEWGQFPSNLIYFVSVFSYDHQRFTVMVNLNYKEAFSHIPLAVDSAGLFAEVVR